MDDDLKQLEAELGRISPAAPSRALEARIAQDLESSSPPRSRALSRSWLWPVALPLAAALAVFALSRRSHPGPAPVAADSDTLKPVAAENVLVSTRDEGLVTLEDGTPARRERRQYIDTITWQNPRTNASLKWSLPREEVLVVPVVFQ